MGKDIIDEIHEAAQRRNIPDAEKQQSLKALANARKTFLVCADGLNNLLFKRQTSNGRKGRTGTPQHPGPGSGFHSRR